MTVMTTAYALRAERVSVRRGADLILDQLSFTLPRGTVTGLVGPSGSGKTMLMRAIVGVQAITEGRLLVGNTIAGTAAARGRIGYMSQSPAVYGDLTVHQNIAYFAAVWGQPAARVDQLVTQVSLEAQAHQLVGSLSGGQRARVSLAIALLGDADLLVLDEPTVGLDPLLRRQLWDLFGSLAAGGKTLLISSHVMDEAERCQELLLLRSGRLLSHGPTAELLQRTQAATVEAAFIRLVEAAA